MIKHLISATALIIPLAMATNAAQAQQEIIWRPGVGNDTQSPSQSQPQSAITLAPATSSIAATLDRWRLLSQPGAYSFGEYAGFLINHPDWPGSAAMRKNAEQVLDLNSYSPSQTVVYFDRLPPVTNAGNAKYAVALHASGDTAKAQQWARKAWHGGTLLPDEEARLRAIMGGNLTSADHDIRADRLLWSRATQAAAQLLPETSAARRPLFAARIAIKTKSPDADALLANAGPAALNDAGLLADVAETMRAKGNVWGAQQWLASRGRLAHAPQDPEKWYETLLKYARDAEKSGDYDMAYRIASQIDDALEPGTVVAQQSIGVRDDYTSLAWLAGTLALSRLNRPQDAAAMFARYANGAKSPQTRSKGHYWAGLASKRAGNGAEAQSYFEQAAPHYDQFYGQLAIEALGRRLPALAATAPIPPVSAKIGTSVYQAARFAGQIGNHREQSLFLRAIANTAQSEQDYIDAAAFSQAIGRPDLSVMAGRNARTDSFTTLIPYAFPVVSLPPEHSDNFTMIHAITRQESQFDREAVSHAGARGLMQLMPGTARETSGRIAQGYSLSGLTSDPEYNIRLGSTYIKSMLNYFGGSYPLAIAAYNAGPGNVNKWLRAYGDPRTGEIAMLDWIERIPLFETRNYVQRVLENAVIYDLQHPRQALIQSETPLSRYLGKSTPG